MDRLLLVANPAASGFTGGLHRAVVRALSRRYAVEAVWPQSAEHARELADAAQGQGVGLVAAMGGDGIVHHVAQALVGTGTALALLPVGTTNVTARVLGLPRRPLAAARLIAGAHQVVPHPALKIDLQTSEGWRIHWAVFAAGVGADAEVVARAETEPYRKYRFGGLHYARTTVATAWGCCGGGHPTCW